MEVGDYWKWAELHKAADTVKLERRAWESWRGHGGSVQEWHLDLVTESFGKGSANLFLRQLRSCLNDMAALGYCEAGLASGVREFKLPATLPDFLTPAESQRVVEGAWSMSRNIFRYVVLCRYAGLRKKEARHARGSWLDFSRSVVKVTISHGFVPKGGRERVIPMHSALPDYLGEVGRGYICEARLGSLSGVYDPGAMVQRLGDSVGIPRLSSQLLRSTFASELVQKGVPIFKVSKWLGHASVLTTERHYAALMPWDEDIEKLAA